jgi:hypothetical protein
MRYLPRTRTLVLALASAAVMISLAIHAYSSSPGSSGLLRYFARLGIDLDDRAILIALGLIPVFWLAGFIIKTLSSR